MLSRRAWLIRSGAALAAIGIHALEGHAATPQTKGAQGIGVAGDSIGKGTQPQGKVDPLADPGAIGRAREALDPLDNDPTIIATEKRLRCTCGCTLDIYTCRTTDFTCTVSPALHSEIRTMYRAGKDPEAIVAFLVEREGPQMLLAPPASGFNLAGYLVPGLSMAAAGTLLTAYLLSKRSPAPSTSGTAILPAPSGTPTAQADLDRLKRALDEVES